MDIDKIIEAAEKSSISEREANNQILENHISHSTVVMSHAELVREGRREDVELAAAIVAASDPTSSRHQQDSE